MMIPRLRRLSLIPQRLAEEQQSAGSRVCELQAQLRELQAELATQQEAQAEAIDEVRWPGGNGRKDRN